MTSNRIKAFRKRNKLTLQGLSLVLIMGIPVLLYWAASANSQPVVLLLLAILTLATIFAMWTG